MAKSGKKPRQKMDAKQHDASKQSKQKKDKDWGFDDILKSKTRRY